MAKTVIIPGDKDTPKKDERVQTHKVTYPAIKCPEMSKNLKEVLSALADLEDAEPIARKAAEFLDEVFNLHNDDSEFNAADYIVGDPWADAINLSTQALHVASTSDFSFREILEFCYTVIKQVVKGVTVLNLIVG